METIYDVAIVGAGVAGSLIADKLSKQGKSVILLEAGPNEQNRAELQSRYFAAPAKGSSSPYPQDDKAMRPSSPNDYYVQTGPDVFHSTYERRVGGTTWHWHGLTPRMVPNDFQMNRVFGRGVDWPISYEDLEPYYLAAEQELGVAGDSTDDHGSPRSDDLPYPPLKTSSADHAVETAVVGESVAGAEIWVKAQRSARNPNICAGSGSCMPLCPTGAKYEAVYHVNSAVQKGAELLFESVASHVALDENGNVDHIKYLRRDGTEKRIRANAYVLAANAIETVRLLQLSERREQKKVANSSDQLGRNLMDHPLQFSVVPMKEALTLYKGPQCTSVIGSHRDLATRANKGGFHIEIFNSGSSVFGAPDFTVDRLVKEGHRGADLAQQISVSMARELVLISEAEQLPDPESRITLAEGKVDGHGLARPQIHYKVDQYAKDGLEDAKAIVELIHKKAGVGDVFHLPFLLGSGHIMGTARMGSDPGSSVVDQNLQSHDHPNLFIVGSSVFPTGATANPTLTIAAMALRLSDYITDNV